jgi:uncharacterized membrane protein YkoI
MKKTNAAGSINRATRILIAAFAFAALSFSPNAYSKDKPKVTKAEALKAAKAAVPTGKILSSELEMEQGKQIWSFDIRDGKQMKEIWVDAASGAVIHNEVESKAAEKVEKKMDKAEAMVKRKTGGKVTSSSTEGSGAAEVYVFQVAKKDGTNEAVRVNAKTMKMVK